MRRIKEALHKLRVTPIYLFPKSRSTRYIGIDQVKDHDAPFIKDYLKERFDVNFSAICGGAFGTDLFLFDIIISPYGSESVIASPLDYAIIKITTINFHDQQRIIYLPPLSDSYKIEFNEFIKTFEIKETLLLGTAVNWVAHLNLIKLDDYSMLEAVI